MATRMNRLNTSILHCYFTNKKSILLLVEDAAFEDHETTSDAAAIASEAALKGEDPARRS